MRTEDVLDAYHDRLVEAGAQHYRQVEPVSFQVEPSPKLRRQSCHAP